MTKSELFAIVRNVILRGGPLHVRQDQRGIILGVTAELCSWSGLGPASRLTFDLRRRASRDVACRHLNEEVVLVSGYRAVMAHEAAGHAKELLARCSFHVAENCSKYGRPEVIDFRLFYPHDRLKLLQELRTQEFQFRGKLGWVGSDRMPEEQARICPLGRVGSLPRWTPTVTSRCEGR